MTVLFMDTRLQIHTVVFRGANLGSTDSFGKITIQKMQCYANLLCADNAPLSFG